MTSLGLRQGRSVVLAKSKHSNMVIVDELLRSAETRGAYDMVIESPSGTLTCNNVLTKIVGKGLLWEITVGGMFYN